MEKLQKLRFPKIVWQTEQYDRMQSLFLKLYDKGMWIFEQHLARFLSFLANFRLVALSTPLLSNQISRSLRNIRRFYLLTGFHNDFAQLRIHAWLSQTCPRVLERSHLLRTFSKRFVLSSFSSPFSPPWRFIGPQFLGCGPVRERVPTPQFVPRSIMRGLGLANQPQ